jgi:hypothetical protein
MSNARLRSGESELAIHPGCGTIWLPQHPARDIGPAAVPEPRSTRVRLLLLPLRIVWSFLIYP